MPRKWIDKRTATHFTLVHRPQNDPLIHDDSAPAMVLNPTHTHSAKKGSAKRLSDLASELGSDAQSIRDNEGEAAQHGVYFDDSEYDYMQHMRDLGQAAGGAHFVDASPVINNRGNPRHVPLEDALRRLDLDQKSGELLDDDILPSKNLRHVSYQQQQDVPDAIAGFQPDMDPRLREVLEALEDEAYVEEEDGIFQELAKNPMELDKWEFEESYPEGDEDDDGWESDHTVKPGQEDGDAEDAEGRSKGPAPAKASSAAAEPTDGETATSPDEWLSHYNKFKQDQKLQSRNKAAAAAPTQSVVESSAAWTIASNGGLRRKKRKGAMTNPSTYSMSSSVLARTEQMSILDGRFDKIEEAYNEDMDDMRSVSMASSVSSVQGAVRADFGDMLDDFLSNYRALGKSKEKEQRNMPGGLAQLDEIRKGLGPARVPEKYRQGV